MPLLFPTQDTLHDTFPAPRLAAHDVVDHKPQECRSPPASRNYFGAWSAVDDVKNKANQMGTEAQARATQLSVEAANEYQKASQAAQAKAGKIELYSGKYYAACTLGGLLACVGIPFGRI